MICKTHSKDTIVSKTAKSPSLSRQAKAARAPCSPQPTSTRVLLQDKKKSTLSPRSKLLTICLTWSQRPKHHLSRTKRWEACQPKLNNHKRKLSQYQMIQSISWTKLWHVCPCRTSRSKTQHLHNSNQMQWLATTSFKLICRQCHKWVNLKWVSLKWVCLKWVSLKCSNRCLKLTRFRLHSSLRLKLSKCPTRPWMHSVLWIHLVFKITDLNRQQHPSNNSTLQCSPKCLGFSKWMYSLNSSSSAQARIRRARWRSFLTCLR